MKIIYNERDRDGDRKKERLRASVKEKQETNYICVKQRGHTRDKSKQYTSHIMVSNSLFTNTLYLNFQ